MQWEKIIFQRCITMSERATRDEPILHLNNFALSVCPVGRCCALHPDGLIIHITQALHAPGRHIIINALGMRMVVIKQDSFGCTMV